MFVHQRVCFFLFRSKPRTRTGWRGHLHRTTSSVLVAVQRLSQPLPLGRGSFLLSWASENIEGDWKKRSNHMFCCFVRLKSDFVFWIVVDYHWIMFFGFFYWWNPLTRYNLHVIAKARQIQKYNRLSNLFCYQLNSICLMDYDSFGLLE